MPLLHCQKRRLLPEVKPIKVLSLVLLLLITHDNAYRKTKIYAVRTTITSTNDMQTIMGEVTTIGKT